MSSITQLYIWMSVYIILATVTVLCFFLDDIVQKGWSLLVGGHPPCDMVSFRKKTKVVASLMLLATNAVGTCLMVAITEAEPPRLHENKIVFESLDDNRRVKVASYCKFSTDKAMDTTAKSGRRDVALIDLSVAVIGFIMGIFTVYQNFDMYRLGSACVLCFVLLIKSMVLADVLFGHFEMQPYSTITSLFTTVSTLVPTIHDILVAGGGGGGGNTGGGGIGGEAGGGGELELQLGGGAVDGGSGAVDGGGGGVGSGAVDGGGGGGIGGEAGGGGELELLIVGGGGVEHEQQIVGVGVGSGAVGGGGYEGLCACCVVGSLMVVCAVGFVLLLIWLLSKA